MTQPDTRPTRPFNVTHGMVMALAAPMTLAYLTTPLLGLVDTAVVGRLGDAALIGGLAIGAVLFDIIFTTFNFLRSATTGLVAQAIGRGEPDEEQAIFWRALMLGGLCGVLMIAAAPLLLVAGTAFMAPEPAVQSAMAIYFNIRVLAAPISLINYSILGVVLGRGEGLAGLGIQTVINGLNIIFSIWLGLGLGWGIAGVAWATVIGETIGAIVGFGYVLFRFDHANRPNRAQIFNRAAFLRLMALNRDIMIRSFALLAAFTLFTRTSAQFGAIVLAANAILMNIFHVAGYYLDGFATAAEQIVGRSIGANYRPAFNRAISLTMLWGFGLAGATTLFFLVFGKEVIDLLTTVTEVREVAYIYLPWAAATAVVGVLAFQMDGVFIGATWSRDMRNMMLVSIVVFVVLLWTLVPTFANHGLWAALNVFLALRGFSLFGIVHKRADATFTAQG